MEYKELVKHHTQVIKDQNDNKWEVIETSDLEEICEAYHQHKLKLLGIDVVAGLREQLGDCNFCNNKAIIRDEDGFEFCAKCL